MRLRGRVAVITGAARGIGEATARLFAAEGAKLVLNDIDADALQPVAEQLDAVAVAGDASAAGTAETIFAAGIQKHGAIDILINNAGTTADAAFHLMSEDDWQAVMDACFHATVRMCQVAAAHFREQAINDLAEHAQIAHQRKISNTAAASFVAGSPGQANLTAAGGAVVALTRTLARELGGFGINVNAVAPGFIETRLTAPQAPEGGPGVAEPLRQMSKAMTALGRFGQPDDLARVHLFLASSDADFVTGVTIPVSGGLWGT